VVHTDREHHVRDWARRCRTTPTPRSASTAGANGRNDSRSLIQSIESFDHLDRPCGSARIDRLPSARGPNSIRPWNQPTIEPSASSAGDHRAESHRVADLDKRNRQSGLSTSLTSSRSERRAELTAVHRVAVGRVAIVPEDLVPRPHRCTDGATRVAGGRLHPDVESNGPSSRSRRLAAQLSATPPAVHSG
jgi:hypothetical protein